MHGNYFLVLTIRYLNEVQQGCVDVVFVIAVLMLFMLLLLFPLFLLLVVLLLCCTCFVCVSDLLVTMGDLVWDCFSFGYLMLVLETF